MPFRLSLLVLLGLTAGSAAAQITTDRPGFGYSPATVGARVFQVEAGTPEATLNPRIDQYAVPVGLRYGVTSAFEVRVAASVLNAVSGDGIDFDPEVGFRSVTAGVKVAVPAESVDLGVIPEVVIPTEGGGDVVFQVNVPAGFSLGDVGLTLVPGLMTGNGSTQLNAVAVLSRSLGGTLSGYVEAGAFPLLDGAGGTPVVAGAGVATLLNDDTQIDAFFDAGLTDAAPDLLVGVGVSFRID